MIRLRLLLAALLLLASPAARAADYLNLLERGEFFLEKGVAYAPDAIRSLEEAAAQNPALAASDPRLVAAIAKAYARTYRYTEAYAWLAGLERAGKASPQAETVREYLLNEAGVGRLRLTSRFPIVGMTASFSPMGQTRLDVAGKKALERLNEWLASPRAVGPEGLTLLVPEGEYVLASSHMLTTLEERERKVEAWAGDEKEVPLVADYPAAALWTAKPLNRSIELTWPQGEGLRYRLNRTVEGQKSQLRYEGEKAAFTDTDVPLGVPVIYRLNTYGQAGDLLAVSSIQSMAMPPVASAGVEAALQSDLTIAVDWAVDEGSLDRVLVLRQGEQGEQVLLDLSGPALKREGSLRDGPFLPQPGEQVVTYRIEAWVEGETAPAAAKTTVLVPPEVARMEEVVERITPETVSVEWSTFPRDAVAEGYAVYLVKRAGGPGELVGRVVNAFAREFSYVPKTPATSAQWKHFVVPYVKKRFLVEPEPLTMRDDEPSIDFEQRGKRRRQTLPDLALSWKPYPDTRRYLVRVGDQEVITSNDYIEISGLQSRLQAGQRQVEVLAIPLSGVAVPILTLDLRYDLYDTRTQGKP